MFLQSIRRIYCAECDASGAERSPEFTTINSYPLTENDLVATQKVAQAFGEQFGKNTLLAPGPASASEDFSVFGRTWGVSYVFWFVGGTDPAVYAKALQDKTVNKIPSNHSPQVAPQDPPDAGDRPAGHTDRRRRVAVSRLPRPDSRSGQASVGRLWGRGLRPPSRAPPYRRETAGGMQHNESLIRNREGLSCTERPA